MALMADKIYNVGIYCRLSKEDAKEDGKMDDSSSISTQKHILTEYVQKRGWHLIETYVDDGYSGTNFNRPGFQAMLKDIEKKRIDCVITKDLSRLGRNYLDCGLYLEVFFPEHGIRYIAVNDNVDTLNRGTMDITPFRNILNEMYASDVSMKVRTALKSRFNQGLYTATSAPYGYRKDPNDKNHLLIDEKVAPIVKMIFDRALQGDGIGKIRRYINEQHILRPAAYAVECGQTGYQRFFEDNEDNRYYWSHNSIRAILRNPIYAGNLVGYKREAVSMKSKKRNIKAPEDWLIIPNTHEAIVPQEQFDIVQRLVVSRRREKSTGYENIFSGLIKCADCGYAMTASEDTRKHRDDVIDRVQYYCNNYTAEGLSACSAHKLEARDLHTAVLADIRHYADLAIHSDDKTVKAVQKQLSTIGSEKIKALEREKKRLIKRLNELDALFSALYEDKVMERITQRNYDMVSKKYEAEQEDLSVRLSGIEKALSEKEKTDKGVIDFFSLISHYSDTMELTAEMVNALIDKITVSERERDKNGSLTQTITIYYKFVGDLKDIRICPANRRTVLQPRVCASCGAEYIPNSNVQKYCPCCSERIRRKQSAESKKRSRAKERTEKEERAA